MHMETNVCSCKPPFLSLSFSSATKQRLCHTQHKKCLKFIWSLPPHINFYMHVIFFFGIWCFLLLFRMKKKSISFKTKLSVVYFGMDVLAKKAWKHTTTTRRHQLHNTAVLFAYLKFLFTWIIFFFCRFMLPLFFGEHFFPYSIYHFSKGLKNGNMRKTNKLRPNIRD